MTRVRLFGWAKELAGTGEAEITIPHPLDTEAVWKLLETAYPALAPHRRSFMLAVNREYAAADAVVKDGDEVAVIPPVSGG